MKKYVRPMLNCRAPRSDIATRMRFAAALLLVSACGFAHAGDTLNKPAHAVNDAIGRKDAGYIWAIQMLHERMRKSEIDSSDYKRFYKQAQAEWLSALFGSDSLSRSTQQVQTAWPKGLKAPAPGIGVAAWMLALYEQGFGVVGISRLSWKMAHEAYRRKALIFVESQKGFRWVVNLDKKGRNHAIVLSDSSVLECGKKPRFEICALNDCRQWIAVFPYTWQACLFLKNSRSLAKNAGTSVFWYGEFLKHYLIEVSKAGDNNPLPQIPRRISCD